MENIYVSGWFFIRGVVSRSYYWVFALLLDPFDIYGRFKPDDWPDYSVSRTVFWIVLIALILWTSILTYHELRMQYAPRPPALDPPDIAAAKLRIGDYVANALVPADEAATEAVRLSAYAFMRSRDDSPAGRFGWAGILTSGTKPATHARLLQSLDWMRAQPLSVIEQTLLNAIIGYRVKVHQLIEVARSLAEHDRLSGDPDLSKAVRHWRPLHDTVLSEFDTMQRRVEYRTLRSADKNTYLTDPNYDVGVLQPLLGG